MAKIAELASAKVFFYFEEISKIPRSSFNEKGISDYLVEFAKERNFEYYQDEVFNVIIKKSGTLGYENAPIIAIQGHTDMVCEKNKSVEHDFLKDPIKIIYDGDFIKADGTTLGADNGIAVAMALALLDSKDIEHPPLEAIFTSSEESGMEGVSLIDYNKINAKILLNIDSDEEGVFTVGCAGGIKFEIELPICFIKTENNLSSYVLSVTGLKGGHSGVDINKGRGNSNEILTRILYNLSKDFKVQLNSICGGSKDNAIPREAEAMISFDEKDAFKIKDKIENIKKYLINEYKNTESNIIINFKEIGKKDVCLSKECFNKVIGLLSLLPNGIQTMSNDLEGLPESSMNTGVIEQGEKHIKIIGSIRSAVLTKKEHIMNKISILCELVGASVNFRGDYPAWEYNSSSLVKDKCIEVFKNLTGCQPEINIIHAGLECGIISKKLPDIDLISFGPNLYDIHSPDERASIPSINRTWIFLLQLIKNLR